jgi:hypothetical protein
MPVRSPRCRHFLRPAAHLVRRRSVGSPPRRDCWIVQTLPVDSLRNFIDELRGESCLHATLPRRGLARYMLVAIHARTDRAKDRAQSRVSPNRLEPLSREDLEPLPREVRGCRHGRLVPEFDRLRTREVRCQIRGPTLDGNLRWPWRPVRIPAGVGRKDGGWRYDDLALVAHHDSRIRNPANPSSLVGASGVDHHAHDARLGELRRTIHVFQRNVHSVGELRAPSAGRPRPRRPVALSTERTPRGFERVVGASTGPSCASASGG